MDEEKRNNVLSGQEIVNEILSEVPLGTQTLVDVSRKMLGGKETTVFAVEHRKIQPEPPSIPPRRESPSRDHVFHDAIGFANYLKTYKTSNTVVLVDIQQQRAVAVLDEKAMNGFESVTLSPITHALFEPWDDLLCAGKGVSIRYFAEFLRKNRRGVVAPELRELIQMLSQIKVSRNITLHKGFGAHSLNGIVCEMEIAGAAQTEEIKLPETVVIEVPLFVATEKVKIEVDLIVDANDSEVFVKCSSADVLEKQIQAFDSMLEKVVAIDDVVVALGSPGYESWDYLE